MKGIDETRLEILYAFYLAAGFPEAVAMQLALDHLCHEQAEEYSS